MILKYTILLRPMKALAPVLGDRRERGMSAKHDRVDWIGGFPYEFASLEALSAFLEARGFSILNCTARTQPRLPRNRGAARLMCGVTGFFRPGGIPADGAG